LKKKTKAESITIWTDVDGVYSADPRKVPGAVLLDQMSYTEVLFFLKIKQNFIIFFKKKNKNSIDLGSRVFILWCKNYSS